MKKTIIILTMLLAIPNILIAGQVKTATQYDANTGNKRVVEVGSSGIWEDGWRLETSLDSIDYWVSRLQEGNLTPEEIDYLPNKSLDLVTPKIIQIIPMGEMLGGESEPFVCRGSECDQYLVNEDNDNLGYSVVSRYKTTLRSSMSSSQATIPASSMTTFDDHVITSADYGSKAFLVIEPGSSREEITKATGNSTTNWTGVTRGLAFYGTTETSVAANRKAHNAGSILVMSNTHYVYEQLIDKDTNQTLTGDFTVASSTDDDIQTIIYGTSTPSSIKNEDGVLYYCNNGSDCATIGGGVSTYSFTNPLGVSGNEISMATNTAWFLLDGDNGLSIATSTGSNFDLAWGEFYNNTTTKDQVFNMNDGFQSNASSTVNGNFKINGNATTTGSFHGAEFMVDNLSIVPTTSMGVITTASVAASANYDTAVTTGFRPNRIELVLPRTLVAGSTDGVWSSTFYFDNNTNFQLGHGWFAIDGANPDFSDGYATTTNPLIYSVGAAKNSSLISIESLSDTGFTIRLANTKVGSPSAFTSEIVWKAYR